MLGTVTIQRLYALLYLEWVRGAITYLYSINLSVAMLHISKAY